MPNLTWQERADRLFILERFAMALRFQGYEQRAEACEAEYSRLRAELLAEDSQ